MAPAHALLSTLLLCTLATFEARAQKPALTASEAPWRHRGTLTTSLRVGKTTLPAGTQVFRTDNKSSLLYRTPGMPGGQYLGVSRRAFGKSVARALATINSGTREKKSASDVVKGIPTERSRWHEAHGPVLLNRQIKGVENLSRMFGLPDSTHYDALPTGLKARLTKTTTMHDVRFHADGRVSGMDLGSTVRQFATKPGKLEVRTWTNEATYRGNKRRQRGIDTSTTWRSDSGVQVDYGFNVGSHHGKKHGTLKKLATALGLKVQAGDRLDYSIKRTAAGAMEMSVKLTEHGKDPVQRTYHVVPQSRGVLFDPVE